MEIRLIIAYSLIALMVVAGSVAIYMARKKKKKKSGGY